MAHSPKDHHYRHLSDRMCHTFSKPLRSGHAQEVIFHVNILELRAVGYACLTLPSTYHEGLSENNAGQQSGNTLCQLARRSMIPVLMHRIHITMEQVHIILHTDLSSLSGLQNMVVDISTSAPSGNWMRYSKIYVLSGVIHRWTFRNSFQYEVQMILLEERVQLSRRCCNSSCYVLNPQLLLLKHLNIAKSIQLEKLTCFN